MIELSHQSVVPDAAIIAEIKESVQKDQLEDAAKKLSSLEGYQDEGSSLLRRLNRTQGKERKGTISRQDAEVERNKIGDAFLQITSSIEQELSKLIDIPFVILAMMEDEANKLIKGTEVSKEFQEFRNELSERKIKIEDLLPQYGKRREDWRPYHQKRQDTIEKIILNTFEHIDEMRQKPRFTRLNPDIQGLSLAKPQFKSTDFFNDADPVQQHETWEQLNDSGYVLIVDAVSLFHPTLPKVLKDSGIPSRDEVAIIVLSPLSSGALRVNELIKKEFNFHLSLTYDRFDRYWDKHCEIGVGYRTIQRWICAVLPRVQKAIQKQIPLTVNLEKVSEVV